MMGLTRWVGCMRVRFRITRRRLLAAALVTSVASSLAGQPLAGWIRPRVQAVFMPFGDGGMYLTRAFTEKVENAVSRSLEPTEARKLRRENENLRNVIFQLERRLHDQQQRLSEVQGFRNLYGRGREFPWILLPARVVLADSLPYGKTRTLNVGGAHGVTNGLRVTERILLTGRAKAIWPENLSVVTATALVGRVVESSAQTARLQLLTDPGCRMLAKIVRDPSRRREITLVPQGLRVPLSKDNAVVNEIVEVQGDGSNLLIVSNVKEYHNVWPGDYLVSCREDYYLPAGVLIGRVERVEPYPKSPGFVRLRVRPQADLANLRNVYIVVPRPVGRQP